MCAFMASAHQQNKLTWAHVLKELTHAWAARGADAAAGEGDGKDGKDGKQEEGERSSGGGGGGGAGAGQPARKRVRLTPGATPKTPAEEAHDLNLRVSVRICRDPVYVCCSYVVHSSFCVVAHSIFSFCVVPDASVQGKTAWAA